jgi:hypothetical protein
MSTFDDVETSREGRTLYLGDRGDLGEPDERGEFAVFYVYEPDGGQTLDSRHTSLKAALLERDLQWQRFKVKAAANGRRATGMFGVQDLSGNRDGRWLDWNDLDG